jgi:hypothetical protein
MANSFQPAEILEAVEELTRQAEDPDSQPVRDPKRLFPSVIRRLREGRLEIQRPTTITSPPDLLKAGEVRWNDAEGE